MRTKRPTAAALRAVGAASLKHLWRRFDVGNRRRSAVDNADRSARDTSAPRTRYIKAVTTKTETRTATATSTTGRRLRIKAVKWNDGLRAPDKQSRVRRFHTSRPCALIVLLHVRRPWTEWHNKVSSTDCKDPLRQQSTLHWALHLLFVRCIPLSKLPRVFIATGKRGQLSASNLSFEHSFIYFVCHWD